MTTICTTQNIAQTNDTKLSAIVSTAIRQAVSLFVKKYQARKQHRIDRQAFLQMLKLDDRMLADIGVTHGDVLWASNLPIEVNAARELTLIRRQASQEAR